MYNSCSKSIQESLTCNMSLFHMQACQPITAEAGYTKQTCPFKQSVQSRG